MDTDTLVTFGAECKALGNGKLGGYLVLFSDSTAPDLAGDFFTPATDFGPHKRTSVYYQHGLDADMGQRVLCSDAALEVKDAGIWVEAQLALRDEYERSIYELAEQGKLGWSSGTAAHLVRRTREGKAQRITRWPLGLDASLTPTPCEPRTQAVPLKSLGIRSKGPSDSDKRTALLPLCKEACGAGDDDWCYVTDIYETSVVWECSDIYYEATYTVQDGKYALGKAKEVVRQVSYKPKALTERDIERILRDAGFSRRDATAITLHGIKGAQPRDAAEEPIDVRALTIRQLARQQTIRLLCAGE